MYIKTGNAAIVNTEQCIGITAGDRVYDLHDLVAYYGDTPFWMGSYETQKEAETALNTIYEALKEGKQVLDLGEINHG